MPPFADAKPDGALAPSTVADRLVRARAHLRESVERLIKTADGLCGSRPRDAQGDRKDASAIGFIDLVAISTSDIEMAAHAIATEIERIENALYVDAKLQSR